MRYLAISLIVAIVLISGCVQFDDFGEAKTGIPQISFDSTDITVNVEAYPTEVKSGRNISLYFDLYNKHTDMSIKDFDLTVYDLCVFGSGEVDVWKDLEIGQNKTKSETIKLKAGNVDFERECELKFQTSYEADITKTQTVAVLKEAEYYQREQADTLNEITISSSSTSNPLDISITFSEQQPFLEGEENYMYIDYSYSGDGYINSLSIGSIVLDFPNNMKNVDCNDYAITESCVGTPYPCEYYNSTQSTCQMVGCRYNTTAEKCYGDSGLYSCDYYNKFSDMTQCNWAGCSIDAIHTLNREKTFINKAVPRTTCTFTTTASQPIDSKTLTLEGTYKYSLDNSLLVKVKPR